MVEQECSEHTTEEARAPDNDMWREVCDAKTWRKNLLLLEPEDPAIVLDPVCRIP
jgi:hypothetical protein